MRRRPPAALLGILQVLWVAACAPPEPPRRVVLVTLDTLRYDGLFPAQGRPAAMPLLLARARHGTTFPRAFSATSSTQPTHASLFTGLHPWQHGVSRNGAVLGEEVETVAERLAAAGWATGAAVASFPVSGRFGFAQGFGAFRDRFDHGRPERTWNGVEAGEGRFYSRAAAVTDAAFEMIAGLGGERQLLWIHYFDAHAPYGDSAGSTMGPRKALRKARQGPEALEAQLRRARALYDQDLGHLDRELDRLLRRLEAEPGWETHVVLTADHGESFGEDGSVAHGRRLLASEIHVPLVILSPRVPPGIREDVTGSVDLARTLLSLAGVSADGFAGRDLTRPAAGQGGAFGMRRTFELPFRDQRLDGVHTIDENRFYAVGRDGVVYRGNAGGVLAPEGGGTVPAELEASLEKLFAGFERQLAEGPVRQLDDEETREGLRALGYAD